MTASSPRPPYSSGMRGAEEAEGLHLLDQRLGILVGVLELGRDGHDVLRTHSRTVSTSSSASAGVDRHGAGRYLQYLHRIRYDTIGVDYTRHRRPDPRVAAQIDRRSVTRRCIVDVGAGGG